MLLAKDVASTSKNSRNGRKDARAVAEFPVRQTKLNVPWMIPAIRNNNWKQVVWLYAKMDENHEAGLSIVISLLAGEASASAGAQR